MAAYRLEQSYLSEFLKNKEIKDMLGGSYTQLRHLHRRLHGESPELIRSSLPAALQFMQPGLASSEALLWLKEAVLA